MPEAVIDIYDIAENDRGELLVAIPDQLIDAEAARYSFSNDDLLITYEDGRVLRLPDIPEEVRIKMRVAKEVLVVESGESTSYTAAFTPIAATASHSAEQDVAEYGIEELHAPETANANGAIITPVLSVTFPLIHRGEVSANYHLRGDDLILGYADGSTIRLPQVDEKMKVRLEDSKEVVITEGGLVRAYDIRNLTPPPGLRLRPRG